MRIGGDRLPAHRVDAELQRAHRRDHVGPSALDVPAKFLPTPFSTLTAPGSTLHVLVEVEADQRRPPLHFLAESRRRRLESRVCGSRHRKRQRCGERDRQCPSHRCGVPASDERWPKIGATSRSEKSITDTVTIISAKPAWSTVERGRQTSSNGKIAATMNVQPSR